MAEKRKQADPRQDKTVSLHPLDPKAAVADLMKVKPKRQDKRKPRQKRPGTVT